MLNFSHSSSSSVMGFLARLSLRMITILVMLSLILIHSVGGSRVHHILPESATRDQCPTGEPCLNLATLATDTNNFLDSNIILILLAGNHTLDTELTVSNTLQLSVNGSFTANIVCRGSGSLEFINITQIEIIALNLTGCSSKVSFVDQFTLKDSTFLGNNDSSSSALLLHHVLDTKIIGSSFTSNTMGHYRNQVEYLRSFMVPWANIWSYNARVGGALVVTSSTVNIISSYFDSNRAQVGGAIVFEESCNVTISNCTFVNNSATGCNCGLYSCDDRCHGGAMFIGRHCTVTAHNSSFVNNTAGSFGGAVALFQATFFDSQNMFYRNNATAGGVISAYNGCRIILDCSYYNNNIAYHRKRSYLQNGGVMYLYSNNTVTVKKSSFDNNVAGDDGGVMYASLSDSITVDNSSFDNNEAGDDGGVMCAHFDSSITVGNSTFGNNEAGDDGGVMYASSSSSITVGNSTFGNNEAGGDGGVMYASSSSSITVGNSSFDNNEAGDYGGVMYASRSSITVNNSSFNNNKASHGGVMHAYFSSSITVDNSSFDNNEAGDVGGVMYASRSSITVNNSSFNNNKASYGGVMHAYFSSSITVDNSSFDNNEAGDVGGVMYASTSSITVNNSSFNNDKARYGGVMYAYSSSSITVGNSSFGNNEAGVDGGVMYAYSSNSITVGNSTLDNNKASRDGGVVYALDSSSITVDNCSFGNNQAYSGGVMYATDILPSDYYRFWRAIRTIDASVNSCSFLNNSASKGGVIYIRKTLFMDQGSVYSNNIATSNGGVITLNESNVTITASSFVNNTARNSGGVLYNTPGPSYCHEKFTIILKTSNFYNNKASSGGAIAFFANSLTVAENNFTLNKADRGGAIYLWTGISLTVNWSNFLHNFANGDGGAIYSDSNNNLTINSSRLNNNGAKDDGGVVYLSFLSDLVIGGDSSNFFGNQAHRGGVVYARGSNIDVYTENSVMMGNSAAETGGAIHISAANLTFSSGNNTFVQNKARAGGVVYASSSIAKVHSQRLLIVNNTAIDTERAVCGYSTVSIYKFTSGGAVHLTQSQLIFSGADTKIVGNQANFGGAVYASESKLLIGNDTQTYINVNTADHNGGGLYLTMSDLEVTGYDTYITGNRATNKGGGIHATNSSIIIEGELHLVSNEAENGGGISLERSAKLYGASDKNDSIEFISNRANCHGGALYVDDDSNLNVCKAITTILSETECFLKSLLINFYDNSANVSGSNLFGGLLDGNSGCITESDVICSCPIGFQLMNNHEASYDCVCTQVLQLYIKTHCNVRTQSIIRKDNFWITYISSSGYLIYPQCPFDYCYPPDKGVSINLNLPNGSDAQCDLNRIGTLCGTCKTGFSLSLGSSKCLPCPSYWPALLVAIVIVFILSGIGLVALVLMLNLTVAIGTLNAVIFYANIVAANKSALFPSGVSFASVVFSWLNLDFGFDVCFFDGMDTYVKTWLQLAFPTYIIILANTVIIICSVCGRLAVSKDRVATLATVILLSYSKLLQIIIITFSSATLIYPDGLRKYVWLPDASVTFFTSKHAALFFIATLILLSGLVYTFLLRTWQWFLRCPEGRLKWIGAQKLSLFLETYHTPYVPKHHYWTGLLLLVRVSVYLTSAFNTSGDPRVVLLFSIFVVSSLILYIAAFGVKIYKLWLINAMEMFTYFNIIFMCAFTWYTLDVGVSQAPVVNVSVAIIIVQIFLYHIFQHTKQKLFSRTWKTEVYMKFVTILQKKTETAQ